MFALKTLILAFLCMTTGTTAFSVRPLLLSSSSSTITRSVALSPLAGMAQPEVETKTKTKVETQTKQKVVIEKKQSTDDPISRREEEFQDAPMYKVMLLEDDSYDSEHVVTRLCAIIEDLDEDAAATIYNEAMGTGKAMCGKYPFEVAELYKEQLLRSDPLIYCDLEDENE